MPKKYADGTTVSVERTVGEILATLKGYGCSTYAHAVVNELHQIVFVHEGNSYKMHIVPPDIHDYVKTETGRLRKKEAIDREYDQEYRRRARVLLIAIKAKLEMVSIGQSSVEKEFLGDLVLPSGRSMYQWAEEKIPRLGPGEEPEFTFMLKGRNDG